MKPCGVRGSFARPALKKARSSQSNWRPVYWRTCRLQVLPLLSFWQTNWQEFRDSQPSYVFHEYLAATNDGFWLGDFVEHARHYDLAYVVDAQFCRWEGYRLHSAETADRQSDIWIPSRKKKPLT